MKHDWYHNYDLICCDMSLLLPLIPDIDWHNWTSRYPPPVLPAKTPGGRGGGNDTPWLWVLPPEFLTCFGVKFSNIHPASESGFLQGIFSGGGGAKSIVIQISFVMLIFLLFSNQFFWGGGGQIPGQIAWGKKQQSAEQCIKTQKWVVFEGNPNKLLYCMPAIL